MAAGLIGIYIDVNGGDGLAGARICLVEETQHGRIIMRVPDGEEVTKVAAVFSVISAADLASMVRDLHHDQPEQMVS